MAIPVPSDGDVIVLKRRPRASLAPREYATTTVAPTEIADPALGGPMEWISVLGTTGLTAYVGGVAVQLAKAAGARVVAIAGGKDRIDHAVNVLGADSAVDYRSEGFAQRLQAASGDGFDLFFDNVGGSQLTLALSLMKDYGTIVLCGSVSSYERPDDPDAKSDLRAAVFKRLKLQGFIVSDWYPKRLLPIRAELAALIREQKLRVVISEFDGLHSAPDALATVFERGSRYIGRRVVRIAPG